MKKYYTFIVLLFLSYNICAQIPKGNVTAITKILPFDIVQKADKNIIPDYIPASKKIKPKALEQKDSNRYLIKKEFASSGNLFSVQYSNIRCLSYNPLLNLVAFTYSGGGTHGSTSNDIKVSYTTNIGATFDSIRLKTDTAAFVNRFPTGVIINKTGNTDPQKIIMAYSGSYLSGSNWQGHLLASEKLDSSVMNTNYHPWSVPFTPSVVSVVNMTGCSDEHAHGFCPYLTLTASGKHYIPAYAEIINGSLTNADTLAWDTVHFRPAFMHATGVDSSGVQLYNWGQAWSEDGNTGYVYFFGVDSLVNFHNGVEPIVYKSTDKGLTWNKMPLFDFSTITSIEDSIWTTKANPSLAVPAIYGTEHGSTVDNLGNLHIATIIKGHYSIDPDSLDYTYKHEPIKLYDIYTSSTGWNARFISFILSEPVKSTDPEAIPCAGGDPIGWDHRIQVSRYNGDKIFIFWNDVTDTTLSPRLSLPDILGKGWDVYTGINTAVKNFTQGTAYDGDNFFMCVSDKVLYSPPYYFIPVTTTVADTDATLPCTHYYFDGIRFGDEGGLNDLNNNISFVSQNYPNPFNGTTTISVSLRKPSNVILSVSNILGQKVYEESIGCTGVGTHTYTIDGSKLQQGIYFYTIKAGDESVTRKMIVD